MTSFLVRLIRRSYHGDLAAYGGAGYTCVRAAPDPTGGDDAFGSASYPPPPSLRRRRGGRCCGRGGGGDAASGAPDPAAREHRSSLASPREGTPLWDALSMMSLYSPSLPPGDERLCPCIPRAQAGRDPSPEDLPDLFCPRGVLQWRCIVLRSKVLRLFCFMLLLCYLPVSAAVLRMFACAQIGPTWYLAADYNIECDARDPKFLAFRVWGAACVALYVLGIPALVLSIVYRSMRTHVAAYLSALLPDADDAAGLPPYAMAALGPLTIARQWRALTPPPPTAAGRGASGVMRRVAAESAAAVARATAAVVGRVAALKERVLDGEDSDAVVEFTAAAVHDGAAAVHDGAAAVREGATAVREGAAYAAAAAREAAAAAAGAARKGGAAAAEAAAAAKVALQDAAAAAKVAVQDAAAAARDAAVAAAAEADALLRVTDYLLAQSEDVLSRWRAERGGPNGEPANEGALQADIDVRARRRRGRALRLCAYACIVPGCVISCGGCGRMRVSGVPACSVHPPTGVAIACLCSNLR